VDGTFTAVAVVSTVVTNVAVVEATMVVVAEAVVGVAVVMVEEGVVVLGASRHLLQRWGHSLETRWPKTFSRFLQSSTV